MILAGLASLITPACNRNRVDAGYWEMEALNGECFQIAIKNQRASAIGKIFDEFVLQDLLTLERQAAIAGETRERPRALASVRWIGCKLELIREILAEKQAAEALPAETQDRLQGYRSCRLSHRLAVYDPLGSNVVMYFENRIPEEPVRGEYM